VSRPAQHALDHEQPNAAEIDELGLKFLLIDERVMDLPEPLQFVAREKRILA
jgi:hypothetical protein